MITHRVSIQWLYEQQLQTCVTDSEPPNAELRLLLLLLILIIISLQATGAERYEVYTDTFKLSFSSLLNEYPSNSDERYLSQRQVATPAHLKYSLCHMLNLL